MSLRSVIRGGSIPVRFSSFHGPDYAFPDGLFDRVGTRLRHLTVLLPRSAAGTDRADELAARNDRYATLKRHCPAQREDCVAPAGERVLEYLARPAEQGGGASLFDRDLDRAELRVVHALEIDQEPAVIDDGDRIGRRPDLRDFGDRRGGGLLGIGDTDRRAIGRRRSVAGRRRWRSLRARLTAARQRRQQGQQNNALRPQCPPISQRIP